MGDMVKGVVMGNAVVHLWRIEARGGDQDLSGPFFQGLISFGWVGLIGWRWIIVGDGEDHHVHLAGSRRLAGHNFKRMRIIGLR